MSETGSSEIPFFTLGEAAKQAGVSKPTLSKAIKTGRISAEKQPDGSYRIQPVYPPETHRNGLDRSEFVEGKTGSENRLVAEQVGVLRERLALLTDERERERQQLTDQIEDLRRRLDAEAEARRLEGEERRKLTALLTHERPETEARPPMQAEVFAGAAGRKG